MTKNVAIADLETASMQLTTPVKLAKYLIAQKFSHLLKEKPGYNKAVALVKETFSDIDKDAMTRMGFPKHMFEKPSPFEVVHMFVSQIKKVIKEKLVNNSKITAEEAQVIQAAANFFAKWDPSEAQINRVVGVANKISPKFGSLLPVGDDSGSKVSGGASVDGMYAELRGIVKTLTGKVGVKVSQDELKRAKTGTAKEASLVSNYNAIRRKLVVKYDQDFAAYIGKQDKPPYVHDAYAHMAKLGYETQRVIKALKKLPLKVNVSGGKIIYLTEDGREIDGGIPPDAEKITFMKTYDPASGTGAYLSYTTPTAAGVTRKYTTDHKNTAGKQKFDKADAVAENIGKYVTKWTRDLSSKDDTVAMAATVCMLIYKTGMRVGTSVGSRSISGDVAYGALTLLSSQVTLGTGKITLKYKAKKQVDQVHVIPVKDKFEKKIFANLKEFKTGKKAGDLVFSIEGPTGKLKRLTPEQLNSYLKSMGYSAGIHKIRHVRGTNLAIELLNKTPWRPRKEDSTTLAKKQLSAEGYIKNKILEPVANLLGHKSKDGKAIWQTSISNYLNPKPFIKWFLDNGLRVPKWVPKTVS